MKLTGIDTCARITQAQAKTLVDNDVSFVGRYLVPLAYNKAITADEIATLHNAGLAILLVYEIGAEAFKKGAARGAQDGAAARKLAEGYGAPAGTVIYFACDYNIPDHDLIYAEDYIRAAQSALGDYVAGTYGPYKIVEFLFNRGACSHFWQCVAWSPRFLDIAQTWQYQWQGSDEAKAMAAKIGVSVDMNTCDDLKAAGMWLPKSQTPPMWYDEAMRWAADAGLIKDGRPNDYVTRAELATVLFRLYGPSDSKDVSGLLS